MFSASISRTLAAPSENASARARMSAARRTRSGAFSAFESSTPAMARRDGGITMAHATTGPARGPRPTSSTPAINRAPARRSSRSMELQRGIELLIQATELHRGIAIRLPVSGFRLFCLRRAGHGNDDAHFLLLDARRLARDIAQVEQLRAPHAAATHHGDLREHRRVDGEDALHADAGGDLAHREALGNARPAPRDAHALERLETLFVTLLDAHVDAQRVAGADGRNGLHPFLLGLDERVHDGGSKGLWLSHAS